MKNLDVQICMKLYREALLAEKEFCENYNGGESFKDVQFAEQFYYALTQYEEFVPLRIRKNLSLNSSTKDADLARKITLNAFRHGT